MVTVKKNGAKLIKCRNPWGRDSYFGHYGAFSPEASDPDIKAQIPDIDAEDDGFIYVPADQFKVSFRVIKTNYNTDTMKFDYYLKYNDQTAGPRTVPERDPQKAVIEYCDGPCAIHQLVVHSKTKQKVWVSLNFWRAKTMPDACSKNVPENKYHVIHPSPTGSIKKANVNRGGTTQLGPFNFDADTFQTFTLGLNWQGTHHPHDWSITVYGQSGDVFVYNLDGSKTMEWGKSASMAKLGPKSKPASWNATGKTELTIPN